MSVQVISDPNNGSCLYCTTTMWAFGPVVMGDDAEEKLRGFLRWLPVDARKYPDDKLADLWSEYQAKAYECQDCYQWVAGDGGPQKDKDGNVVCQSCYEKNLEAVRGERG